MLHLIDMCRKLWEVRDMAKSLEFFCNRLPALKEDPVLTEAQYVRLDAADANGRARRAKTVTTSATFMVGVLD